MAAQHSLCGFFLDTHIGVVDFGDGAEVERPVPVPDVALGAGGVVSRWVVAQAAVEVAAVRVVRCTKTREMGERRVRVLGHVFN